jgi:hypothetical protein
MVFANQQNEQSTTRRNENSAKIFLVSQMKHDIVRDERRTLFNRRRRAHMQTMAPQHDEFVDDFFGPESRETLPVQGDAPRTCFLCGKPALPSERGIHPDCARKENFNGE